MSQRFEIDLEQEKVQLDGAWLTVTEVGARVTQMIASGDLRIGRLAEALEQLGQAVAGAKSLTLKLSGEQYAKLEAAGAKLGKGAEAFARDLLMQVLAGGAAAPQAEPKARLEPIAAAPVTTSSDVTADEAAQALTMPPKRRDPTPAAPPIMTPVTAAPAPGPQPSVVVDLSSGNDDKSKAGATGPDGRRWFNRT